METLQSVVGAAYDAANKKAEWFMEFQHGQTQRIGGSLTRKHWTKRGHANNIELNVSLSNKSSSTMASCRSSRACCNRGRCSNRFALSGTSFILTFLTKASRLVVYHALVYFCTSSIMDHHNHRRQRLSGLKQFCYLSNIFIEPNYGAMRCIEVPSHFRSGLTDLGHVNLQFVLPGKLW